MSRRIVFIIDSDLETRQGLQHLLQGADVEVETYDSGESFLRRHPPERPACLVSDISIPGCSGLEVQSRLRYWPAPLPIVFMTSHDTVPLVAEAMRRGAADFIVKPICGRTLLRAVERALTQSEQLWADKRFEDEIRARLNGLTRREREVFALVTEGMLNKQVAARLGTSEKTIEVHRSRVMHKLGAKSLAELVRLADRALSPQGSATPMAHARSSPRDG